jgi:hypothetical protein
MTMGTEDGQIIKTSRGLLQELDQLEAAIKSAQNKRERLKLFGDRDRLRREFAMHLCPQRTTTTTREVFISGARQVTPTWKIAGTPSKRGKGEATTWMETRSCPWDGSAQQLRHEVQKALEQGDSVPVHSFGLHCEWTVEISEGVFEWYRDDYGGAELIQTGVRYR